MSVCFRGNLDLFGVHTHTTTQLAAHYKLVVESGVCDSSRRCLTTSYTAVKKNNPGQDR